MDMPQSSLAVWKTLFDKSSDQKEIMQIGHVLTEQLQGNTYCHLSRLRTELWSHTQNPTSICQSSMYTSSSQLTV